MKAEDYKITSHSSMTTVTQNKNGLLFEVDGEKEFNKEHKNLIYINGSQLAHYNKKGQSIFSPIAGNINFGHVGDWYNQNLKPYVFKYIVDKDTDGVEEFKESLEEILKTLDTDQNILIGKSYGGVIASYLAQSNMVQDSYAINPSLCGTPLSDLSILRDTLRGVPDLIVYEVSKTLLEPGKRFTEENAKGVDVDYSPKIHIYGGCINDLIAYTPMQLVMHLGADKIVREAGKLSDGMAIWDEDYYQSKGFDINHFNRPYHYLSQNSHQMEKVYQKIKQNHQS